MAEIIDCTKCAFYNNGKCGNPNGMACNCVNNAVCYYKELKRLEKENARLKEEVRTEKIYSSQIEELEESIVGQRNAYKKLNSMYEENCEYTGKLEQTLQEIKAIICGNYEIIDPQGRKDILKLINKAEEE